MEKRDKARLRELAEQVKHLSDFRAPAIAKELDIQTTALWNSNQKERKAAADRLLSVQHLDETEIERRVKQIHSELQKHYEELRDNLADELWAEYTKQVEKLQAEVEKEIEDLEAEKADLATYLKDKVKLWNGDGCPPIRILKFSKTCSGAEAVMIALDILWRWQREIGDSEREDRRYNPACQTLEAGNYIAFIQLDPTGNAIKGIPAKVYVLIHDKDEVRSHLIPVEQVAYDKFPKDYADFTKRLAKASRQGF